MEFFFYLETCIWPDAMDPTKEQLQLCVNLGRRETESLTMLRHAFGEVRMRRTGKVQTHGDREKARQVRSKSHEHAHHFL
jgi:hypothetical protein